MQLSKQIILLAIALISYSSAIAQVVIDPNYDATETTDTIDGVNEEGEVIESPEPVNILTETDIKYMNRLSGLQSIVPLDYNSFVRRYIEVYTVEKSNKLATMLGLQEKYFPIFERIFAQYGVPLEMKYLSVIESALNPNAISRSGAAGLWQFMPATGRLMGLKQDTWVDERRDPYKATYAAARYLMQLYNQFYDWHIVMASYNCGPGCIGRKIKSTGINNYWQLRPFLRTETAGYVPAYIGATYAMNYGADHGVYATYCPYYYEPAEEVPTTRKITLKAIAKYLDENEDQLGFMNPELVRDCTPPYYYNLRLPVGKKELFFAMYDSIVNFNAPIPIDTTAFKPKKRIEEDAYTSLKPIVPKGKKQVIHTVKKGETLNKIAAKYGVELSDIKKWNGSRKTEVMVGQKVKIYTLAPEKSKATTAGKSITYIVKSGESLNSICDKYPKNTVASIKKLNGLKTGTIKPGQKIKLLK
jgi:membrane-bound lytic murein transglycosylase D